GVPDERSDPELPVLLADLVESADPVQVDDRADRRDAELQHGDQALTPGHHLRVAASLPESFHHLLDRRRCEVVEARWIHRSLLFRGPAGWSTEHTTLVAGRISQAGASETGSRAPWDGEAASLPSPRAPVAQW